MSCEYQIIAPQIQFQDFAESYTLMSQLISAIRVPASAKPAKAAIIFVHGLGDSGEGWSWFPQLVSLSGLIKNHEAINYVFPNAPSLPITANGGYIMPGWFDIYEFNNPNAKQDVAGFLKSSEVIKELIREQLEVNNIPPEKIIIGGFSQGAAVALATASLLDHKIGGVVALSGFCPASDAISKLHDKSGANFKTPIFQGHGTADPVINFEIGKQTSEFYQNLGFKSYSFKSYSGVGHSADDQELKDVLKFVDTILS